ncbi:MAG: MtaA/CmuA family methyltransferase [Methanomassiliicoccales archaeon]|jgi:MtaA/CmuA family methyltransferase|nr:MtaA/CmuA family methyltransferase [Methanomassiliicoccales archaeon]
MNEKERLISALRLEGVDRVPCACPLQTGTIDLMKITGAYWPDAHKDADLMTKLAIGAHDIAGIESVRVPFDVTVDASAFGAVTGKETIDRQPSIIQRPIKTPEDIDKIEIPDPYRNGRAPIVIEAVRKLSERMKETPVICAIISPFMLAGQLRGEQEAIMDIIKNPDFLKRVLEISARWGIEYSAAAIQAGADIIAMVDATSSGTVLGPSQYAEFAMPYQKMVADSIRKNGAYSILHICGNTTKNLKYMAQTGVNGISVDQQMDISWVKEQLKGKCATIGNVSPTSTLLKKSPADVEDEVRKCIEGGTDVVAPGCGFAPETPLENMRALVNATKKYGKR